MKKSIILFAITLLFTLTSCNLIGDDLPLSDDEQNITIHLSPLTTYFLGLNNDLSKDKFSSFSIIESVDEIDGDIRITLNNDISIRSDNLASGSRGGFGVGGFSPAIIFDGDSDDDTPTLEIAELNNLPQVKRAKEEDGKTIITIDGDTNFEFRLMASGSRGGFAMGGFSPAIVFDSDSDDDTLSQEEFENLEKVYEVFTNSDNSITILLDSTLDCKTTLMNNGSRGGFGVGGFSPAIIWTDEGDGCSLASIEELVSQEAIRSVKINDNNQLKIVIENGFHFRFAASGSRGGFAVGGYNPAIVFTGETNNDSNVESEILFRNSSALTSYELYDDGSSTVKINKEYQDEIKEMFHDQLTAFLEEINNHLHTMQYTLHYEQDLSKIELIVHEEFLTRHDIYNDYYATMYQILEHYQYLFHLFSEKEISYEFIVKYENKIFYNNDLLESIKE